MTERPRPTPELLGRIRALSERRLSPEEVRAALLVPIGAEEREGILLLVEWFRRRYPTPANRLAYVRRAYRRWQATLGANSR
jgi:hypothetical protein